MIIDGRQIAQGIHCKIKNQLAATPGRKPGLAVILVGDDPASTVYVRNKSNACKAVGFYSETIALPATVTQAALLAEIARLNQDEQIDGILVQLPLPEHLNINQVTDAIHPQKDVDGFHSQNSGRLMQNRGFLRPCTPKGVMALLTQTGVDLTTQHCVVVGQSNIVGRPMAIELLNAGATVTICHRKTQNLPAKLQQADIIVVAIGQPKFIKDTWVKRGAIVIDVGINRLQDGTLCGDVDFDSVQNKVAWITPVPGGVGPMTIAMLLENTLMAYQEKQQKTR